MRDIMRGLGVLLLMGVLAGCSTTALLGKASSTHESSSVVDYLYPNDEQVVTEKTTNIRLPVKVGLAFVPSKYASESLPEKKQLELLRQVKDVFEQYPYIEKIEVIPSAYLRPKGGFENLGQVGRMFGVDVMALVSYDQIQFNDANKLSLLYWTIAGAYMIQGDQYDTQTMLDTAVVDIKSHKLLFRAPGVSSVKGTSTMVNYQELAREARQKGYEDALQVMIPNLQRELLAFKERVKRDQSVHVYASSGFSGGGSFSWSLLWLLMGLLYGVQRRR